MFWVMVAAGVASAQAPARPRPAAAPAASPAPEQQNGLLGGNTGILKSANDGPIEINTLDPKSEVNYTDTAAGKIATAGGGVHIQTTDANIYSDYAEYNLDTHEALLIGNVRIYRDATVSLSEEAVYNFDTKAIRSLDFRGSRPPYDFSGLSAFSPGGGLQYNMRDSTFTTHDSSKPDFHLHARRVRIYPDDRIIYIGTTLYVGQTPVFYFPYFFQSLDRQSGYQVTPGYTSEFGAYIQFGLTFPVTEHITGLARVDYRSSRGIAGGLNFEYKPNRDIKRPPTAGNLAAYASDDDPGAAAVVPAPSGSPDTRTSAVTDAPDADDLRNPGFSLSGPALTKQIRNREGAELETYFALDDKPDLNRTSLNRLPVDSDRYAFSLKQTAFFTDDFYLKVNVDKISDRYLLQDFFQAEFTRNPNPDNVAFLTYYHPGFIATLLGRGQFNEFFDTTERLPEFSLEIVRQPISARAWFTKARATSAFCAAPTMKSARW